MYHRRSFAARGAAKNAAIEFIEACCSRKGPHPAVGHKVPAEVTDAFFERTAPELDEPPMAARSPKLSCPKT